jgi:Ca-activated chloride channel family protein
LITDADVSPQSLAVARELRREGYVVSVLAVGTEEGAPIPDPDGGFVSDGAGQVIVPRLDTRGLRELAEAGRGRYAQLTGDDSDLDQLFPATLPGDVGAIDDLQTNDYEADVWRDEGIWLALLLLPFVALGFRRGWVAAWFVGFVALAAPPPDAQAFELRDLFVNRDQRGYEALEAEEAERAAALFENPSWRAAAQYRAGDYAASVATLGRLDTAQAHYNRGNALARTGQLEPAIQAYERALQLEPGHGDAEYNRDLLRELLEQNEQQNQQDDQDQQQNAGEQGEQGEREASEEQGDGSQSEGEDGEPGDSPSQSASSENEGQGPDDQSEQTASDDASDSPDPREADGDQESESDGQPEDGERQAAQTPGPEDLEQWASEQAAEQWLRRVPQDPGGLLRRKFLYQYQRLGVDQDGNVVWPGDEAQPW